MAETDKNLKKVESCFESIEKLPPLFLTCSEPWLCSLLTIYILHGISFESLGPPAALLAVPKSPLHFCCHIWCLSSLQLDSLLTSSLINEIYSIASHHSNCFPVLVSLTVFLWIFSIFCRLLLDCRLHTGSISWALILLSLEHRRRI